MNQRRYRYWPLLLLPLALASCSGEIGDSFGVDPVQTSGTGFTANASSSSIVSQPGIGAPFEARMQRLTAAQYRATITDVFGPTIVVPDLEPDPRIAGFDELGAATASTSARGVELYGAAAESIAKQVLGDSQVPPTNIGCAPASGIQADDVCAGQFLDRVGRRLFRRPLDAAERSRYLTVASQGAAALRSFSGGLQMMLTALLESPLFIYRAEWAEGAPGSTSRIKGYDMAARLSFGLMGSSPDDSLLDGAGRGELDTDQGILPQAKRLVSSARGQKNIETFFSMMLRLPNGMTAEALAKTQETLLVLRELRDQNEPFTAIYTAPFTFVDNTLAELYGLPDRPGTILTKVMLPTGGARRGLLGHAGVLGESGLNESPILRGKYIREALLCQSIPPPPPNVVPILPPETGGKPQTMRERLAAHRASSACASCHGRMDPIGLGLENFDGTGRYRDNDRGMPIDPSGDLDGVAFADAIGLGTALSQHPDASKCFVTTLHRRLTGQFEDAPQAPVLDGLSGNYVKSNQTVDDLMLSIVSAETFLKATLPSN